VKGHFRVLPFRFLPLLFLTSFGLSLLCLRAESDAELVKELMSAGTVADFKSAAERARAAGMSEQQIAEGKLLYGIRSEDVAFLEATLGEVETAALDFEPNQSLSGIASVEQFRGLIAYGRALQSLAGGNEDEFRKHVEKAFWLFPEQGGLFGRAVARWQRQQRMDYLRIDFSRSLLDAEGEEVPLGTLLGSGRGLLLICWRNDVPECMSAITALVPAAKALEKAGVQVVVLNVDRVNADIIAREALKTMKVNLPWLAEGQDRMISKMCELGSVPRAVLISDHGRILFNGAPNEPGMWRAVRELVPTFQPPSRK
jgi:hypothetical protein